MSSLSLDPGSQAGELCSEKLVLEMSRWSCCGNTFCSRNLPSVSLKVLVSELLFNHSC